MHFPRYSLLFAFVRAYDVNPRISIEGDSGITVTWQSPTGVSCGTVRYGVTKNSLGSQIEAQRSCTVYKGDSFYHASLLDLAHSTRYFYTLSCASQIFSFRTRPKFDSPYSFSIAFYADLGPVNGEDTISSLKRLAKSVDMHIFAGDIGYADDAFMHGEKYISRFNEFLYNMSSIGQSVPIMVAPGNHEAEDHTPLCLLSPGCRAGLGNFTAYNCAWNTPNYATRNHNMWYSFDYGPIHFVMINTETDYPGAPLEPYGEVGYIPTGKFGLPGEFEKWLETDLKNARASNRPWVVVVGHRPISVLDDVMDPYKTPLTDNMVQLIGTYADVYIAGHVHYYARSRPKINYFKPTLITVGGGGCDEWNVRRIQTTVHGETDSFEYFGYGNEQTFGMIDYVKDVPDALVFRIYTSAGNNALVDEVVLRKNAGDIDGVDTTVMTE